MLGSAAVTRIKRGLGFRTGTELDTAILDALKEEQRDLEKGKTLPKFLLVEDAALALATGTHEVNLPADFLRRSDQLVSYTSPYSDYPRLVPWRDYNSAILAYQGYNPGGPAVVSLRQTTLWFEPEADRAYDLVWTYYRKADEVDLAAENDWLDDDNLPEILIGGAGLRIALDARNEKAIEIFSKMKAQARVALYSETVLEEAHDVYVMGGNS